MASTDDSRRSVLVTGAAGRIGSYFAEHSNCRYRLRLMVQGTEPADHIEALKPFGEVVVADLSDASKLRSLCGGMDTMIHLAGNASPEATWEQLLPTNIVGTYNAFAAAKFAGCRRIIYASSIHAISGYPCDVQVKTSEPVNPGDLYGVSKCFGEALGRYMAEQEGISVICIRIGGFQPIENVEQKAGKAMVDAIVTDRDLQQLIERAVDVDDVKFAILHGLSDNRFKRMDLSDTRTLLGYAPVDDATELNVELKPLHLRDEVIRHDKRGGQKSGMRETEKTTRPPE